MAFVWDKDNLSKALGNALVTKIDFAFKGRRVVIDSRRIEKGDIFVALKGDNFDGNKFAEDALKKGAVAAIVDNITVTNSKFILVNDALVALQKMGKYRRKTSCAEFIGITGSVGKTSCKELVYTVLATKYKAYKTEGNFNNHIGLPLTLCNMPDDIEFAVIELGMNHAGEISDLVRICNPDIAAISWVSESHIEYLGSLENIARAKAEIFEWMKGEGIAVIPADSDFHPLLNELAEENGVNNIYSFGRKANALTEHGADVVAYINDHEAKIPVQILDGQILNNVLLTLTIGSICGVPLDDAIKAISTMAVMKGRGGKITLKNGAVIIDDSYNASPTSMKLAMDKLATSKAKRKIATLGIMKELGKNSKKYHEQLAEHIVGIDALVTCGNDMKYLYEKAKDKIMAMHFKTVEETFAHLKSEAKKGDLILIKGSHGSNMWKIVDMLTAE